jgi:hypothetical protein
MEPVVACDQLSHDDAVGPGHLLRDGAAYDFQDVNE